MFGRKTTSDVVTEQPDDSGPLLEALAIAADPETARLNDEMFVAYVTDHQRQYDGWSFRCTRWGDFLTLFIERQGQPEMSGYIYLTVKKLFSTSLNISSTREIRLETGHGPDQKREVSYAYEQRSDSDGGYISATRLTKGGHFVVTPKGCAPIQPAPFVVHDAPPDISNYFATYYDHPPYQIQHTFPNGARPAADDRICFEGIGMTLYAPFGRGSSTYDAIMAAIKEGKPE